MKRGIIPASLHGMTEVEVYPQVSGIIREVTFKEGVKVSRGQTLFVIDQTEHKLNVMNAQANLAAAKAQMETTKMQYESRKKLAEKKIVSDYMLSTAHNAFGQATSRKRQAEARRMAVADYKQAIQVNLAANVAFKKTNKRKNRI